MKQFVIILGIFLIGVSMLTSCGPRTPEEAKKVIFEKSEFSRPITLSLPSEDDPKHLERLKNEIYTLKPIFHGSANRIDKAVLEVLIRHGFVKVEKITVRWRTLGLGPINYAEYDTLIYADNIRPYIYRGDYKKYGENFEIRLASRVLKSIEQVNEYRGPGGPGKFYAVTFSYTLRKEFPFLEELVKVASSPDQHVRPYLPYFLQHLSTDRAYKGRAEAYLEPASGQWKLVSLTLEDKSPSTLNQRSSRDKQEIAYLGRKVSKNKVVGKYILEDDNGRIVPGSFEFKKDNTLVWTVSSKWEMYGDLIRIKKIGDGTDLRFRLAGDTLISGPWKLTKEERTKPIKKTEYGTLWEKYVGLEWQSRKEPRVKGIKFEEKGTCILTFLGHWDIKEGEGNVIRIYFGEEAYRGRLVGDDIVVKDVGIFKKQASGWKALYLETIVLVVAGFIFLFAIFFLARKSIRTILHKRSTVPKVIYCTQCGKENPESANFCTNCGERL